MKYLIPAISTVMLASAAFAQNAPVDKDAVISVLQQQRNNALDQAAVSATQLIAAQKEIADLKAADAKIKEPAK
jgi:hypothetical protein